MPTPLGALDLRHAAPPQGWQVARVGRAQRRSVDGVSKGALAPFGPAEGNGGFERGRECAIPHSPEDK